MVDVTKKPVATLQGSRGPALPAAARLSKREIETVAGVLTEMIELGLSLPEHLRYSILNIEKLGTLQDKYNAIQEISRVVAQISFEITERQIEKHLRTTLDDPPDFDDDEALREAARLIADVLPR